MRREYQAVCIVSMLLILISGCKKNQQPQTPPPKPYPIAIISAGQVDIGALYPASLRGKQDIEVRPRISSYITQLCVDEGSIVKKGQALFRLDPVTYQEAVTAAESSVKAMEANVASNELTVQNKKLLMERNIISEMEYQSAVYALEAMRAQLAQAKAQLTSAKNDLSYTTVASPSDGIVGSIPYRVGSLVSSSITEPLTIVSDISSIYAYFALNEKQLFSYTRKAESITETIKQMPSVKLLLSDGSLYEQEGVIETISGVINSKTGAVTLRACFANPRMELRSGGSANVRIPAILDSAIYIPQKATYELQNKRFVYVVTDSMTVKSAPIETLDAGDGKQYIVTSGLNTGEKVVIEGMASLSEGMKITVQP